MALDARVRYTKMMIRNSFITLLKEKAFHEIKLKEVCQLAGINRSTFYKYYRDIFDWKEQIEKECLTQAREVIDQIDTTDLQTILVCVLSAIKKDIDLYRVLFSKCNDFHILEQFLTMSLEKTEHMVKGQMLNVSSMQGRWSSYYGAYGCLGVIRCWIEDGLTQSPEEVADYIVGILTKTMISLSV